MPERAAGGGAGPGGRPPEAPRGPHGTRVRGTRQAEAVASVLDRLSGFCSAQQIHAELRERGEQVGLTTVYRHLQVLSETGRIDAIRDSTGEILYRRCQTRCSPSPSDLPELRQERRGRRTRGRALGRTGRPASRLHRGRSHRGTVRAVPRLRTRDRARRRRHVAAGSDAPTGRSARPRRGPSTRSGDRQAVGRRDLDRPPGGRASDERRLGGGPGQDALAHRQRAELGPGGKRSTTRATSPGPAE